MVAAALLGVGERIGAVGLTGNTSGPHLHLEIRKWDQPTDPTVFFWAKTPGYTGDVPGWVLVTLMTAGLVVLLWSLAGPALKGIFDQALAKVAQF